MPTRMEYLMAEQAALLAEKVDTCQDFLIKFGIKPFCIHCKYIQCNSYSFQMCPDFLCKSVGHQTTYASMGNRHFFTVIVRPTKIMNRGDKNWALFLETNP